MEEEKLTVYSVEKDGLEEVDMVVKPEEEWQKLLTPMQFSVTRKHGTERAFSGEHHDRKDEGIYKCVCCGTDLFSSGEKYDSGTGWPSFLGPVSEHNIRTRTDTSFFMKRTEVLCARCGAHLGHVFEDGPPPAYKRYCMNSAAFAFQPKKKAQGG